MVCMSLSKLHVCFIMPLHIGYVYLSGCLCVYVFVCAGLIWPNNTSMVKRRNRVDHLILMEIKVLEYISIFSVIFTKGNNFPEFLFLTWITNIIQIRICS